MSISPATTQTTLMTGADIVVKSLVDHGVEVIFAYPGGCSMPLHQALTRYGDSIRTILPRHEQGGAFAAQGYARSTGRVGVLGGLTTFSTFAAESILLADQGKLAWMLLYDIASVGLGLLAVWVGMEIVESRGSER